ncbi:MAG: DMT family transporter [Patescibacteria group bacterium]
MITSLSFTTLAILSALLGAVANIIARTLLRDLRSQDILGINFLTMGATLLLISPLFYFFQPSLLVIGLVALIGVIDTFANYFYFKTFEKTEASIATPLLSLAPGFTFFFAWLTLGESSQWYTYLIAAAILVLTVYVSTNFSQLKTFQAHTLIPALVASFLFGVSAIPAKYLLDTLHAVNAPTLYMFRAGFISLFTLLLFGFPILRISTQQYRVIFFRGLIVISQWVLLYFALSRGNSGVTLTLGNITPIFVFFLSVVFLREKPTPKKILAALCIFILSFIIA